MSKELLLVLKRKAKPLGLSVAAFIRLKLVEATKEER
jgi:hypothetical protein